MPHRDVIVIGASAGGLEPLRAIVAKLPADLPATILVVLHIAATARSVLPEILGRASALRCLHAVNGKRLEKGTVVVAPPDHHLVIRDGRIRLSQGPRENGHRPAVDPLFRSAARWHGRRAICVVLSGALDDGTTGALAVKVAGGVVVAQQPDDALYPSMPSSVIQSVGADYVAIAEKLPALLERLVREEVEADCGETAMSSPPTEDDDATHDPETPPTGAASFTCPDCHGALWELKDGALVRYRCRVGHAYAPESLMDQQAGHVDDALWTAYRALQESAALAARLGGRARLHGHDELARRYEEKHVDALGRANVIRAALDRAGKAGDDNGRGTP